VLITAWAPKVRKHNRLRKQELSVVDHQIRRDENLYSELWLKPGGKGSQISGGSRKKRTKVKKRGTKVRGSLQSESACTETGAPTARRFTGPRVEESAENATAKAGVHLKENCTKTTTENGAKGRLRDVGDVTRMKESHQRGVSVVQGRTRHPRGSEIRTKITQPHD